jgi:hypothetical protein
MNADDGSKGHEKNEVEQSMSFSTKELMDEEFGGGSVRHVKRWILPCGMLDEFSNLMPSDHRFLASYADTIRFGLFTNIVLAVSDANLDDTISARDCM